MIWMSTPSLVVFVGNWWRKRSVWMHYEHMEPMSEVVNQVEQAKTGKQELKSQIYKKRGRAGWARRCAKRHKSAEVKRFIVALVPDVKSVVPDDASLVSDVTCVVPDGTVVQ